MIIGTAKEIKNGEFRVAITPKCVAGFLKDGHKVVIETGAGLKSGISDDDYAKEGAEIVPNTEAVYRKSDLIYKVKEILPPEYDFLRDDQIIFTYIHSANRPGETSVLLNKKVIGIAYEDVETGDGEFPLLTPMSELAGQIGMFMGIFYNFNVNGGNGKLAGGVPGVEPAKITILGAGNVGTAAAKCALGLGADVTIMDTRIEKLKFIKQSILPNVKTLFSDEFSIKKVLPETDILLNAVKWYPGLTLVSRSMLKLMKRNALIVDVDAEPNGAIETCRYSTFDDPIYVVDGIRHFCVPNLPSAAAYTSSAALSNATFPFALELANKGWLKAIKDNPALRKGTDFVKGFLTFKPTADVQNRVYTPIEDAIKMFE